MSPTKQSAGIPRKEYEAALLVRSNFLHLVNAIGYLEESVEDLGLKNLPASTGMFLMKLREMDEHTEDFRAYIEGVTKDAL